MLGWQQKHTTGWVTVIEETQEWGAGKVAFKREETFIKADETLFWKKLHLSIVKKVYKRVWPWLLSVPYIQHCAEVLGHSARIQHFAFGPISVCMIPHWGSGETSPWLMLFHHVCLSSLHTDDSLNPVFFLRFGFITALILLLLIFTPVLVQFGKPQPFLPFPFRGNQFCWGLDKQ